MNWFRLGLLAALMASIGLLVGPKMQEAKVEAEARRVNEIRAIALEQTCRTLVEAKLVGTCGLK